MIKGFYLAKTTLSLLYDLMLDYHIISNMKLCHMLKTSRFNFKIVSFQFCPEN